MPSFVPELTRTKVAGHPNVPVSRVWPKSDELHMFPMDKKIKLETIILKHTSKNGLIAVQLKFANGVESPLFQSHKSASEGLESYEGLKHYEIDTSKKISLLCFKVYQSEKETYLITGMRLTDSEG